MATAGNDKSPKVNDANMYSEVIELATLTTKQVGEEVENTSQFKFHYFEIKITGLTANVVIRPEGTMSDNGFGVITDDGLDVTFTEDGIFFIDTTRGLRLVKTRLNWVSGAATTVETSYRGGN